MENDEKEALVDVMVAEWQHHLEEEYKPNWDLFYIQHWLEDHKYKPTWANQMHLSKVMIEFWTKTMKETFEDG